MCRSAPAAVSEKRNNRCDATATSCAGPVRSHRGVVSAYGHALNLEECLGGRPAPSALHERESAIRLPPPEICRSAYHHQRTKRGVRRRAGHECRKRRPQFSEGALSERFSPRVAITQHAVEPQDQMDQTPAARIRDFHGKRRISPANKPARASRWMAPQL